MIRVPVSSTLLILCCVLLSLWTGVDVLADPPRVAGLSELDIYQPGTHSNGEPSVEFQANGPQIEVDVPPAVHVHRSYYNGEKQFQGPLVKGGPAIVVANHPRTGKRLYIEANFPSGVPVIVYDKKSITYVYQDRRVILTFTRSFPHWGKERVNITYADGRGGIDRRNDNPLGNGSNSHGPLADSVHHAASSASRTIYGASATVSGAAGRTIRYTTDLVNGLPVIRQLQGIADDAPTIQYESQLQRATERNLDDARRFVPTNR